MSQRWATSRVEAFSDGVFAIAITLLVLDIKIEPSQFDHLWRALAREWPSYLAYVTSFLTVGGVWLAHHGLFSRLQAVDPVLMRLNILLLMAVSFLPFPTALMAGALQGSESAERAAVVVYGATAVLIEVLGAAAWRYAASQPGLMADHTAPPARSRPTPSRDRARRPLRHGALPRASSCCPSSPPSDTSSSRPSPSSPRAARDG